MNEYKPLPIGIDNFEEIIQLGCYYVDKTLLIKTLLDTTSKVTLFTRPRRFGKSLNLSMLQYFFEKDVASHVPSNGKSDTCELFQGLKIVSAGEKYQAHMGKYPVIMLNFKEAKQGSFDYCYGALYQMIADEYERHSGILESEYLTEEDKRKYQLLRNHEADYVMVVSSIQFLCKCLEKVYQEKVIVLIDEYDVPLENSHLRKFYDKMIDFIRGVLGATLKTNNSLKFAVITGCLRISKESIFTGLNNLEVVSIENKEYGEYFGF
ncbi:MAG: AAA family ATPase, partial [Eubacteriales bacterium]